MSYSTKVIEHYERPQNIGSMDSGSKSVGTGLVGAPECGDVMILQIDVKNDKIVDA